MACSRSGGYACLSHIALRLVLRVRGLAPLRYATFLDHCAERVLLRKVGGSYVFIHRLVQEYFASLYPGGEPAPSPPPAQAPRG